ncbi:MAG: transketolase [Candidatus Omnitrophica bacterium]|nr:transketolase [Candidatus Omnitrophota bacterium]
MLNKVIPYNIRKIILEQSKRANVGHIGSALSIVDIIAALYGEIIKVSELHKDSRDRFVLSKGHAALALYAAFFLKGWITEKDLNSYCADGSLLGVHPESTLPGVDFSTGSLGHGLSMAAGSALGARLKNYQWRVFALMSDAECNEGSVWEAVMFASHHKLSNLIVMVDDNGQQAFGYTKDVLSLRPLAKRWDAFGWDVSEVDGHNVQELKDKINSLTIESGPPHVLIAKTVFGKGVSFMENKIKWHYWPMSDADYKQALSDIEIIK